MDYKMDFLTCGEKEPLYAKYSTFPGWHSSHTYQHKPSTTTCLQHLSEYIDSAGEPKTWVASGTRTTRDIYDLNKQTEIASTANFHLHTKLSHRELKDYIGEVRNPVTIEKQRSDKGRYAERDSHAQHKGWENTWPLNYRGIRENFGTNSHNEMQVYADCFHHTPSKKTPRFEVGEWRSSRCASDIEGVLGYDQWTVSPDTSEQFQPIALMSQKNYKTELTGEHRWKRSPWNLRNTESVFPVGSFRQPPSYMAPPAYSSQKKGDKIAAIPKLTSETSVEAFEQTFESRKAPFTDLTDTHYDHSSNNGHYLENNNQKQITESYCSVITGGKHCLEALNESTVMQYTTINTKPTSTQEQLQYRESPYMTHPDITRMKQTKLGRRKGGETVFCLVSRMGEVSGLSSSPEEPLKSHVLPLLNDGKLDYKSTTTEQINPPQHNDDSRQNQDECLNKDEALGQLHESLMFGEYRHTPLDQRPSSIQDLGNAIEPDENKEELQCYVQGNDSESNCLAQKSPMQTDGHEKPCREIIEKFPLWKEPKYQHHSTGMTEQRSQGINGEPEASNSSTNDQEQSLVVIDATCVVVKVELVLLPEKEHVQYVCLTEESPSTREETEVQKQHSSVISSQETPENNTLDERVEKILEIPHEHPRTSVQTNNSISEKHDRSCESHIVDPVKEFEESTSASTIVDDWQVQENKLMVGHSWSGTTLENNEGVEEVLNIMEEQTTAQEAEAVLKDFVTFTNAKSTSEIQPEKITLDMSQSTGKGHRPALEDSVVEHSTQKDNDNHQTDTTKDLTEDSSTEDNLLDDKRVLDSDFFTPVLWKSAENCIKVVLPSPVGSRTLRRSSSSPHLSFTYASNTLDVSNVSATPVVSDTENEPLLLPSFTDTETTQCSGSPSVQSSCTSSFPAPSSTPVPEASENASLLQTRNVPSDDLLCTPGEQKMQHAKSLWDAVSRIRKHTAPDSETEEEETVEFGEQTESADTDLLYQRLNTEEGGELEDNTLEN